MSYSQDIKILIQSLTGIMRKHFPVLLLFVVVSLSYFYPVLSGKALFQSDIAQYQGMARESIEYRQMTGEETYWNNSAFGGMPTYQLGAQYAFYGLKYIDRALRFLPRPADYLFLYFIGLYFLLISLKVPRAWAVFGALSFGFSTYLIIILGVGHNAKAHAIAYFPWVVAAVMWTLEGRLKTGFILSTLAIGLQLMANHYQMTYYLLMATVMLWAFMGFNALKTAHIPVFIRATLVLMASGLLALGLNATNIMATREYANESTRGPAVVTIDPNGASLRQEKGLDYDYITEYSYAPLESFNLLIARFMGGSSQEALPKNSKIVASLRSLGANQAEANEIAKQIPMYWGDQPIVAAPAYIGGVAFGLALLALFLISGPIRNWAISVMVLALLLSWGRNFPWLTKFFIEYVPLYDKFRAVSSIQVLIEFLIPFIAVLGGVTFIKQAKENQIDLEKKFKRVVIIVIISILVLYGASFGILDFSGPYDDYFLDQLGLEFVQAIREDRASLMRMDTLRTLALIAVSFAALFGFLKQKINKNSLVLVLVVLSVIDLVSVDWRYVNSDDFVQKRLVDRPFQATDLDRTIQRDTSYFRVFDQTSAPFNSARANYFHRQLGGYHAAKPRRIQDLYDFYLTRSEDQVLDMFNVKYIIARTQTPGNSGTELRQNPDRFGAAWFVDSIIEFNSANDELLGIEKYDLNNSALVHLDQFEHSPLWPVKAQRINDSIELESDRIDLITHEPNRMVYRSNTDQNRVAVFSEVYYPYGWQVSIDGQKADMFRANYALRAMIIPEGTHDIVFEFIPEVVRRGELITLSSTILLLLVTVIMVIGRYREYRLNKGEV
jgi:hypothetical protein